jgi:hypothetical protein
MRLSAAALLLRPVRVHGIDLGRPVDLIFAPANGRRAVGFEILCGDEEHRFLPLAAATVEPDEITVASTLTLLDDAELAYYRERASTLESLRGVQVARAGRPLGTLKDLVIGADGGIVAVVVVTDEGEVELPYDADVELPPPRRPNH